MNGRDGAITYAFVGSVVPDTPRYQSPAFARAGNLWQHELLAGMAQVEAAPSLLLSVLPVPRFPRSRRLLAPLSRIRLDNGMTAWQLPFVNLVGIKQLTLGLAAFLALTCWALANLRRRRLIFCFNLTAPPGLALWLAARLTRTALVGSLNDVNIPGQTVPDDRLHRLDFRAQRWLIPRLDGRICVSDAAAVDLAPGRHFLRVDGGATAERAELLAAGSRNDRGAPGLFTVVSAGRIDRTNGMHLLLQTLAEHPDEDLRVVIAGRGPLADRVREAATRDARIDFRGYLSLREVAALYHEADVLLNLRMTRELDTRYFFPSKLLEYLLTGIPVLSTATGHVGEEYSPYLHLLDDETPAGLMGALREIRSADVAARNARARSARDYMLAHKLWDRQAGRVWDYLRGEVLDG